MSEGGSVVPKPPKCVFGPKKRLFEQKVTNNTKCTERGGGVTDLGIISQTKHFFGCYPNNQFPHSTCWVLQIQIGHSTRLVRKMLKSVMQLNLIHF